MLINKSFKQNEQKLDQNEVENQLYKISQMNTFYLKDWKGQKNWEENLQQSKDIECQSQNLQQQQQNQKKKIIIKSVQLKKRSGSLPLISSIALPIQSLSPLLQNQKSSNFAQKQYHPQTLKKQIQKSRNLPNQQNFFQAMHLKKNIETQKKIMKQINEQLKKMQADQNKKHLNDNLFKDKGQINHFIINKKVSVQEQFDKINRKAHKVYKSYNQHQQKQFISNLRKCEIKNILNQRHELQKLNEKNLEKSCPLNEHKARNKKNEQKNQNKQANRAETSFKKYKSEQKYKNNEQQIKSQRISLKSKQFKIHLKRQIIGRILRKYDSHGSLNSQKLIEQKQVQKQRRRELIKNIVQKNNRQILHSNSSLNAYIDMKKDEKNDITKHGLNSSNHINSKEEYAYVRNHENGAISSLSLIHQNNFNEEFLNKIKDTKKKRK